MPVRIRVKDTDFVLGTATESTGAVFERGRYFGRDYIRDISPSSGDGELDIVHSKHSGGTLNGVHWWNPGLSVTYNKWIADRYQTFDAWSVAPDFSDFDINDFAARVGSAGNPSKPHVDLPISFVELRELPQLMRSFGGPLLRRFSNAYLGAEFGIKPFINDIYSLMDFTVAVEQRIKRLERLVKYGYDIKKTQYRTDYWRGNPSEVWVNSLNFGVKAIERPSAKRKIWGYSKWVPTNPFTFRSDIELAEKARRLVLGLNNVSFASLWNAIPWTWLIDWFSNVGDVLETHRNSHEIHCAGIFLCVEQTKYLRSAMSFSESSGVRMSPFVSEVVQKYRTVAPVFPSLTAPILDGRQLGILSAIGIQRYR